MTRGRGRAARGGAGGTVHCPGCWPRRWDQDSGSQPGPADLGAVQRGCNPKGPGLPKHTPDRARDVPGLAVCRDAGKNNLDPLHMQPGDTLPTACMLPRNAQLLPGCPLMATTCHRRPRDARAQGSPPAVPFLSHSSKGISSARGFKAIFF